MDKATSIGGRLAAVRGRESQAAFASRLGVHKNTYGGYERDERRLDTDVLARLAAIGVDINWLVTGAYSDADGKTLAVMEPAPDGRYLEPATEEFGAAEVVPVRYFPDVFASAGHGAFAQDSGAKSLWFRVDFLRDTIGTFADNLVCIRVRGESMEPSLRDGGTVLIRLDQTAPGDAIYLVQLDGAILLKRIQTLPGGVLRVSSDNRAYEPFDIRPAELGDSWRILGRAVWHAFLL